MLNLNKNMGKEKDEFDFGAVLTAFGIGFPLYVSFAPKWFRKELVEYTGKWVVAIVVLGLIYVLCVKPIRKKILARRRRKEQEELERWQRSARERAQKWREEQEKNKRED